MFIFKNYDMNKMTFEGLYFIDGFASLYGSPYGQ